MSFATAQQHHRKAEHLHEEGGGNLPVIAEASLALADYLEELVLRLGPAITVASLPAVGEQRPVRAI